MTNSDWDKTNALLKTMLNTPPQPRKDGKEGGNIVIIESKPARKKYPPKETLSSMIGVNKDSNLYESADEVDKYIKRIRNEWN